MTSLRFIFIYYLIHPNRKGWHQKARPAQGCFPRLFHTLSMLGVIIPSAYFGAQTRLFDLLHDVKIKILSV